jgi:Ca2+-binding EF-hand superfamily protein
MKEMRFDIENPFLFSIIEDMASNESCSWPKFRSIAHLRMSDRKSSKGLKTIFGLFIDDPQKNTITFKTFKKISEDIGENFTEKELKDIMKRTTENGNEISYKDFLRYMKIEGDGEESDKDEE